jgi:cation diffusion facilitator CzcD-associated flavoprotein CzcO
METTTPSGHVDVLIVGAGLSGIGAGYHLQQKCPGKSYAIQVSRSTTTVWCVRAGVYLTLFQVVG